MFISHKETTLNDLGNGVIRRIFAHGGSTMAAKVNFGQGAIDPVHNHPYKQLTYVLSGESELIISEEKHIVKADDILYRQPNIMHNRVRLKPGTLLDIFAPIRKDFLHR